MAEGWKEKEVYKAKEGRHPVKGIYEARCPRNSNKIYRAINSPEYSLRGVIYGGETAA